REGSAQPHVRRLDRPRGVGRAARGGREDRRGSEPAQARRAALRGGGCAVKLLLPLLFASQVFAQAYPSKPVHLVVGFAPGGAADFVSRAFQEPLGRALGQPVVVDNKPGAGSSIAAEFVAKSPADGHTLLIASPSSILVNPLITPKAGFQPMKDLVPVSK